MSEVWGGVTLGQLTKHRPICYGVLKPGQRQTKGVPLIRISDIGQNDVDETEIYLITEKLSNEFKRSVLNGGEVLLSIQGTIGRVAICPLHLKGANVSRTIAVIDPDKRIDRQFLRYWLLSMDGKFPVGGATRDSLNIGDIRDLVVPLLPLRQQRSMVLVLDEVFAGLATATANAKKNLKNARELFDSYLNSIFEEAGRDWKETTLGSEIDMLVGFAFKSAQYAKSETGVRLLRGDNVIQNALRWDDVKRWPPADVKRYEVYKLEVGDIVLAMDRTWVKAGLKYAVLGEADVPSLLVQRVARLRCREQLDNRFLVHLIGSPKFTRYVLGIQTGLSVPHISGKQISDFVFRKPKLSEQQTIGATLDELASNVVALEGAYREKLVNLAHLKRSILQKAFSGALTAPQSHATKEAAE